MAIIAQHKDVKKIAVLIPAYCEEKNIGEVVAKAKVHLPDVIVVDDASTDATADIAEAAGALVLRQTHNQGKGVSLTTGFKHVLASGFDAVITLDADGFHDANEINRFQEAYNRTHIPVLIGNRMAAPGRVPFIRRWSIRMMSWWLNRLFNVYVADPICGFRFYRCDVLPFLLAEGSSLPSEMETLLNIASRRIRVGSVRITKILRKHKSVLSPFRDLIRFEQVLVKYYSRKKKSRRKAAVSAPGMPGSVGL